MRVATAWAQKEVPVFACWAVFYIANLLFTVYHALEELDRFPIIGSGLFLGMNLLK